MVYLCSLAKLCVIISIFTSQSGAEIPNDVLSRLKNSTTLSEVLGKINVKGSSTSSGDMATAAIGWTRFGGLGSAPEDGQSGKHPNFIVIATIPPFVDGVEVLQDAHQSRDSCKVVEVCTAIPIKRETNMFYFPECIDLPQCLGGCCDNSHDCHPIETQPVKVTVSSWKYAGYVNGQPTFEPSTQILVDMQKHLRCDCSTCLKQPSCNLNIQEAVGCQCVCKNHAAASSCSGGNRHWSNDKCACECTQTTCPWGQKFSQRDCACLGATTTGIPDPVIDMGTGSRSSVRSRNGRSIHIFRRAKTYQTLR